MALGEHDHDITRRYLLGQLTDDEEQKLEERLLSEDDFLQEVELTKDELAQEFVSGELTAKERKWLQENFLASPQGKQKHEFAKTFDHYVRKHRAQRENVGLIERLRKLWNAHPQLIPLATTAAVLVIAIGIYSIIPPSTPPTVASLIVTSIPDTRSADPVTVPPSITLKADVLRLELMLPQAVSPGSAFRVEVLNANNVIQAFKATAQAAGQSITVDIPARQLPRGQYVATVYAVDANGNAERVAGNYKFRVE